MNLKEKLEDYTEQEFRALIDPLFRPPKGMSGKALDRYTTKFVAHFRKVTGHPAGSDLIFWPAADQEDSPDGVLKSIKDWRAQNGKPGFKAPDSDSSDH
ncbi:bacteriocin immunity protein [Pseudomonas sp. DTU_2021_1001937_2_SI_NGA_ILE_001]|uniref:bacteriocin immunity protein n=1 Tax=Pseudomonas sp. DTU_2021_1001937_2_SI_NGA_ILE_001 TaxID=3077589 RepID=UPI0028FC103A|nr:bacteriocin immunity protein [Pseudomonas sp. DTU_2021_1001937_2_SI_NGA_ILE_001]WNW12206.1 bacteriocin immunity protein [Pseudomonas sp. DTU_2021_1001937_2_SI_NGA_ILE_001]